ncbi:MAG: hypothetical protein DYH13_02130 [Alphaproteobacteria bacterium PRO2]|nr:hypothetical protein [Alphaproteobacteria bacterium PRO2]
MLGAFAVGIGIVFAIAVTGTGIKGCAMDKNLKNESWIKLFARHATGGAIDGFIGAGEVITEKAEDPEFQEKFKSGVKRGVDVLDETAKSTLGALTEYLNEKNRKERERKQQEQEEPGATP